MSAAQTLLGASVSNCRSNRFSATGIRLNDTGLILQGAVPAAVLALVVQGLFGLAERAFVAKGLRIGNEK